ncbi:MAG TPA: hypothetical protein VMU92_09850 [Acidobacteriaceae bacterium]|nr:hypothetical protein [Acidobacteriaceae bacterium]
MKLIRAAIAKFRLSVFLLLIGGNLLLLLCGFAWLQIPDSHTWQFALSMVSALLLVLTFCWIQVVALARLRRSSQPGPLWIRMLAFAVLFAVWLFLSQRIASASGSIPLHAAYWNSRLSPGARVVFTPMRIASALSLALTFAQFLLAALIIPPVLELGTRGLRGAKVGDLIRPWLRPLYWLAVIVAGCCAVFATHALVAWVPGHSVGIQTFSVLARLFVAWIFDAFLLLVVLSMAAATMDGPAANAEEPATVAL